MTHEHQLILFSPPCVCDSVLIGAAPLSVISIPPRLYFSIKGHPFVMKGAVCGTVEVIREKNNFTAEIETFVSEVEATKGTLECWHYLISAMFLTMFKKNEAAITEVLSASFSLPLWPALSLHFNNQHHQWLQVIRTRTGLTFTLWCLIL